MTRRIVPFLLLAGLLLLAIACGDARREPPATLAQASALATTRGVPILVDFYADWCGPCQRFVADVADHEELQQALRRFVVYKVDVEAEGPEGADLAERFGVEGYPTFVILDAATETIDRWWGYDEPSGMIERLERAESDPTTIAEKRARFERVPTASDAAALGSYHISRGEALEAARYYERAVALGEPAEAYEYDLFQARSQAVSEGQMELAELRQAADAALSSRHLSVGEILDVVEKMSGALGQHDAAAMLPYLDAGTAAVADSDDPALVSRRRELEILRALHVQGDGELALALKHEALPEGWNDDAGELNNFAWWCFENEINLVEAERLARRAVELAETPESRAMYLDTAAELVNLRGDRSEAIALTRRAMTDDPDRDYYREQLTRFQGELAEAL